MPRQLPAIRASVDRTVPVGHYEHPWNQEEPVTDWTYDALLLSQAHWRDPTGGWTGPYGNGGGPFFCERAYLKHQGVPLEVPTFLWYGIEYGPTRAYGCGSGTVERIPLYGASRDGIVGNRVEDAKVNLANLQGANYAKGILRSRPGEPVADLGVFLAELRDLPKIPGRGFLSALKGVPLKGIVPAIRAKFGDFLGLAAGEYLNEEFGWRPFVRDLRKFRTLSWNLDRSLKRLIDENGRNIARRVSLGSTTADQTDLPSTGPWPAWGCGGFGAFAGTSGYTYLTQVTTVTTRTWFSAGYRYYIPNTSSWLWKGRAVAVLYGGFPTPRVLYNAIPWTWLIDYFADLSDLVGYFGPNAVDNLVTRYAFTMRQTTAVREAEAYTRLDPASTPNFAWKGAETRLRTLRKLETKQRGTGWAPFGAQWAGYEGPTLTPKQLSILAALGISRAKPS